MILILRLIVGWAPGFCFVVIVYLSGMACQITDILKLYMAYGRPLN